MVIFITFLFGKSTLVWSWNSQNFKICTRFVPCPPTLLFPAMWHRQWNATSEAWRTAKNKDNRIMSKNCSGVTYQRFVPLLKLTCLSSFFDGEQMVNKSCRRIQQQIPIPTASFSSSVDSWPALSLSVEMDKILWVWQKPKIITKLGHVGSLGLHFPSFRFQHVSTVSSSQRGHWKLPVQRVTEATNSGVTTRWSLGVRWFDVGSSCNLCVVKWTKKWPKKTEFQRECLKIIPADAKTVRLSDWPTSLVVFFTSPFSFSDSFSFQDLANTGSGHHWITESMELSWHPFQAQMIPDVGITAYSAYSPMIS